MRDNSGFTLLELVISISLLGIILLIAGGAMRLGASSAASGEKKIDTLERFRTSLNIIDSQVQSMALIALKEDTTENEGDKYFFKGDAGSMQFSTNYSPWGDRRGYVTVVYRVETEDNGKHVLHAAENIIGEENSREIKLFGSLDGISFEYFYKEPLEEKGKWVEQWTDRESVPEKIRVRLADGAKDTSIVIPVRVKPAPLDKIFKG